MNAKFQQIPEWLFSKKITSKQISKFWNCDNITSIPNNIIECVRKIKEKGGMFKLYL